MRASLTSTHGTYRPTRRASSMTAVVTAARRGEEGGAAGTTPKENQSARGASWRAEHREAILEESARAHVPSESPTVIDFLVNEEALAGPRKWLGAAVTENGDVYGVSSHALKVLKLTPRDGKLRLIGKNLTSTHFKFLRGIDGKNGKCYGLPAWGEGVLKIDVESGQTSMIGDLPRSMK